MTTVFDPTQLAFVTLDVMACAGASPELLAARQSARLTRLLDAAAKGSRLYRGRLDGKARGAAALSSLPPVSRAELMAHFDDWVSDPKLKLDQLRAFTADPGRIGEPYLGRYLVWESSGTSHQPGIFVQDSATMAVYDALEGLRSGAAQSAGGWPNPWLMPARIAFVGAIGGHFASIVTMQRLRQINPWMAQHLRCFSILQSTRALVDELNQFAPTTLATYPSAACLLAEEAERGALEFCPREVLTGGETLTVCARRKLERVFGCRVRDSYGASEFMSIGWECRCGHMHANTDWVILEPVDGQGRPTPLGQMSHTTLLTNLANFVQPLIRYDLGDQIRVRAEPCECGARFPVIEVQGRSDDPLRMAGQNGRHVTFLPLALTTVLEDEGGEFDFQLSQCDERTLALRLGRQGPQSRVAMARCRKALQRFALDQGALPIRVIAELGQPLPRGRSGKAQRVVATPAVAPPA